MPSGSPRGTGPRETVLYADAKTLERLVPRIPINTKIAQSIYTLRAETRSAASAWVVRDPCFLSG